MRLPFRIISARRLRSVEAVEQLHDLRFMRDALTRAIQQVEDVTDELKRSYGTPASNFEYIRDAAVRDEIDELRTLRIDLKTCLWRIGGGTPL